MKTIYLFIIILAFSMPTQCAFACGDGGGAGSSDSIDIADNRSKVPYKFLKRPYKGNHNTRSGPLLGSTKPDKVDKDFQKFVKYISKYGAKEYNKNTQKSKTNKKADALDKTMGKEIGKLVTNILICEPGKSPKEALGIAVLIFMMGGRQ